MAVENGQVKFEIDKRDLDSIMAKFNALDPHRAGNMWDRFMLELTSDTERYLKRDVLAGQILKKRTGFLANSVGSELKKGQGEVAYEGVVGSGVRTGKRAVYANIHETGGIIRPKNKKWLTIPIGNAVTRGGSSTAPSVRDFADTFVKWGAKGGTVFQKSKSGKLSAIFLLRKSVKIPARLYLTKTVEAMTKRVNDIVDRVIKREMART